jgi:outer membrane lipoprotein-sorting protein
MVKKEQQGFPAQPDALWYGAGSWLSALFIGLLLIWLDGSAAAELTARALIRKSQDLLRSQSNVGRYRMQISRPDWQRTILLRSWDERAGKRFFIRILAPRKDKDTTFLKVGGNMWMYLPKLERDIKIPPSMMLSSWMGSDFTNDDLVKMSSVVDDYTHRIIGRQGSGDKEVFTIESLPKPEAAVVWGRLVHRLTAEGLPLEQEFYDEHGKLVRRLVFEDVKLLGGRRLPTRWIMQPLVKPGRRTIMEIERIEFDVDIPPTVFKRANLSRRGR